MLSAVPSDTVFFDERTIDMRFADFQGSIAECAAETLFMDREFVDYKLFGQINLSIA
jgi:hypothetical protein